MQWHAKMCNISTVKCFYDPFMVQSVLANIVNYKQRKKVIFPW